MQPDFAVLGNTAQINTALNTENSEWVMNGPRNFTTDTVAEMDRGMLISNEVQLPTPPRSENSPSSLSPRESAAQPFTYDVLYPAGVPQPFAEWGAQQILYDGVAPQVAEEVHLGVQQPYVDYASSMNGYALYAQSNVPFPQHYNEHFSQPHDSAYAHAHPTFGATKAAFSNSATVALFSKHVAVNDGRCVYTIRLRPSDVGRFIGTSGARIRSLQYRSHTTVTVRCANDSPLSSVDSASRSVSQEGVNNGESLSSVSRQEHEASIPVEITGTCDCVMQALREIYFHFPLSEFGPIDVPQIVKSELQARPANARSHQRSSQLNAVNGNAQPISANGAADKAAGNTCSKSKRRRQKAKLNALLKAERGENKDQTQSNKQPTCQGEVQLVGEGHECGAATTDSASQDEHRQLLFSETVTQKTAENSNGRSKQQSTSTNRSSKKKGKAIDIESMKDFPPLAAGVTSPSEASQSDAERRDTKQSNAVDGALEQAAHALSSLAVTCAADSAGNDCDLVKAASGEKLARLSMEAGCLPPYPVSNGPYGPLCPNSGSYVPSGPYVYNNAFGYYPVDYTYGANPCQTYFNGDSTSEYYANMPFVPQKDGYDPQYAVDGAANMFAMPHSSGIAPVWPTDGYTQPPLGMTCTADGQLLSTPPFPVAPCGYDAQHYSAYCYQAGGQWPIYADRSVPEAHLHTADPTQSAVPSDVQSSQAEPAQLIGVLLPCRISALSLPTDAETLEAHVHVLAQTCNGGYESRTDAFTDTLTRFYADSDNMNSHRVAVQQITVGSPFAVRLGDVKWYRAELLSRTEELLNVRLLDYGNSLELQSDQQCAATLADAFSVTNVSPLAIRCRAHTVRSLRSGATLNMNDAFALLSDSQRSSTLGTYVRLLRVEAGEASATSEAELYVDD